MSETAAPYAIDKTGWPRGPWDNEPDRVEFEHAGLPCLLLRHPDHGNWCAYAAVPPGHPLHGVEWQDDGRVGDIEAHMGINYSDKCDGAICHVPKPGEPDNVWWFGCNFGHFRDYAPGRDALLRTAGLPEGLLRREPMEVYRELPYVRRVAERMAKQLAAIASVPAAPNAPSESAHTPSSAG